LKQFGVTTRALTSLFGWPANLSTVDCCVTTVASACCTRWRRATCFYGHRQSQTYSSFKGHLKTYYFLSAYPAF